MKWIREKIDYLASENLAVPNPAREHRRAILEAGKFHPVGRQCAYAVSLFDEKILHLSDGFEKLFGYPAAAFEKPGFMYELVHPEDRKPVRKYTLQAIRAGNGKYQIRPQKQVFHIVCRMQKEDGTLVRVMWQRGMLTRDVNGNMLTSFGILTDISHIAGTGTVRAFMTGPTIPGYPFFRPLPDSGKKFSKREKEVIELLATGLNSEEIGKRLHISEKTVYTHRRNILKKAGVRNTAELISQVFRNGY